MADTPPNVDVKLLADALRGLTEAVKLNGMELRNMQRDFEKHRELIKELASAQTDALIKLEAAMTAPRRLVMKDGKPVGVVVEGR